MKNNWHKDPYLYDDVPVLKNIPGVKTSEELKRIEGDLTRMTMGIVYAQEYPKFNTDTLCQIHRTIFGGIYEWAGEFRTINIMKPEDVLGGDTVRYAQPEDIKKQLDMASKFVFLTIQMILLIGFLFYYYIDTNSRKHWCQKQM